jgi:hypothetical protein
MCSDTHIRPISLTLSYASLCSGSQVHPLGWRDVFDIAVRWRQLSEPNDPVWWIDQLVPEVRLRVENVFA